MINVQVIEYFSIYWMIFLISTRNTAFWDFWDQAP